ncbi:endolytic transglycosylase MltG [Candidatus Roizmanbacteria bacterium]|nr:endolytic transglycosylase MltG [Candidatus Roizmanbacteria bacterium]
MKLKNRIILLTVSVLIFAFVGYLIFREGTLPVDKNDTSVKKITIEKGVGLDAIAKQLMQEGLIRNKVVFFIIVKQNGIDKKLQAGNFRLSPSMDTYKIAQSLTKGTNDVWLTVVEGLRKEEIASQITEKFLIPEIEFNGAAQEGYLFPDTYLIPAQASVQDIVSLMRANFDKKFTSDLKSKARTIGLTEKQVVILASLVEREAKYDDDRKKVASILVKRFQNDWPLQIDATVQYVLGYQPNKKTWWKADLTDQDLQISSSYNTYKNKGIPPAPICNPGLKALVAVATADPNIGAWYYVSDATGHLHFASTLEEHNENIKKYLR